VPTRGGPFRALRRPPFRRFYLGQAVSASGTFLQQTALGWLVLRQTHSPADLGLVLAAGSLPSLVAGPWGGVVADRINLRPLLIGTQSAFALLAGALWLAAEEGRASLTVIVVIGVLSGLVQVLDSPARQAFVAVLVPPEDLSSAVSLNGVVVNTSRAVGPAAAGIMIATVGTTPCFAVNTASYLAVIVALLTVHPAGRARGSDKPGGVLEALRYAASRQQLWLPLAMMAVIGLLAFNFAVVLPVLVQKVFKEGGGTYGLLATTLSIGSIVGSLAVGLIRHPRRVYLAAAACLFGAGLVAVAVAPDVATAAVALAITGAAAFSYVTLTSTTLQLHSSAAFRGRIMALFILVYIGTTPIGSSITGWICAAFGARADLLVGAAGCVVAGIGAFFVRTPPRPDALLTDLVGSGQLEHPLR
jgi:MFS family permease